MKRSRRRRKRRRRRIRGEGGGRGGEGGRRGGGEEGGGGEEQEQEGVRERKAQCTNKSLCHISFKRESRSDVPLPIKSSLSVISRQAIRLTAAASRATPASQCAIKAARMLRLIHASRSVAMKRPPVADLRLTTAKVAGSSETCERIYGATRLQIIRQETQNLIANSVEQKPSSEATGFPTTQEIPRRV